MLGLLFKIRYMGELAMQYREYINEKVHGLYWNDDLNCATTTLITNNLLAKVWRST